MSVDLNPLVVVDGVPLAVDALVELRGDAERGVSPTPEQFRALFEPRGIVVAGASSHPGKFGFVALHNILAAGLRGPRVRDRTARAGRSSASRRCPRSRTSPPTRRSTSSSCARPPPRTPTSSARARRAGITGRVRHVGGLRRGRRRGAGGGARPRRARGGARHPARGPERPGRGLDAGVALRADRRPLPAGGAHRRGQPVGQLRARRSSTTRCRPGIGISRAVSAGNAAAVTVPDYLDFYADDPETATGLAYVEGLVDGRAFFERVRHVVERKPLVLLKGGATAGGQRAAASHTGALAADDDVFDGMCRQAGVTRAATVEEAFEAAATFATQPLPQGPRVAVVTTAGGWGVVTADAITRSELELVVLPDDLRDAIDEKLPPRWSRNNPIDLAGGETRDTIPEVLAMVAGHDAVDAVIYLGLGIQSNQAELMREGPLLPGRRARADRRLPRAPGRAVRPRGRGGLGRDGQAGPHRHRARGRRRPTTPDRERCAPADGSATRRRTGRSSRSSTCGATRGSASGAASGEAGRHRTSGASCAVLAVAAIGCLVAGLRASDADGLGGRRGRGRRAPHPRHAGVVAPTGPAAVRRRGGRGEPPGRGRLARRRHRLVRAGRRRRDRHGRARRGDASRRSRPRPRRCSPRRARSASSGPDATFTTSAVAAAPPVGRHARPALARRRGRPGAQHPGVDRTARGRDRLRGAHRHVHAARRSSPTRSSPRGCARSPVGSSATDPATRRHRSCRCGRRRTAPRSGRSVRSWSTTASTSCPARSVPDPALAAAADAGQPARRARGVAVGSPSTGTAPAQAAEVASINSAPLSTLVTEMLSASDNGTAESLALAVGRQTADTGTTAAGLAGITSTLTSAGVDLTGVSLVDGSGLSAQDRLTCNALAADPRPRGAARATGPWSRGWRSLAQRGTLTDRFAGTPIQGRLLGQDGHAHRIGGARGRLRRERGDRHATLRERLQRRLRAGRGLRAAPIAWRRRSTRIRSRPRRPSSSPLPDRRVAPPSLLATTIAPHARAPEADPAARHRAVGAVVLYFQQETVVPLKSLGRYIALGVAGSFLMGFGVIFCTIAALRAPAGRDRRVRRRLDLGPVPHRRRGLLLGAAITWKALSVAKNRGSRRAVGREPAS